MNVDENFEGLEGEVEYEDEMEDEDNEPLDIEYVEDFEISDDEDGDMEDIEPSSSGGTHTSQDLLDMYDSINEKKKRKAELGTVYLSRQCVCDWLWFGLYFVQVNRAGRRQKGVRRVGLKLSMKRREKMTCLRGVIERWCATRDLTVVDDSETRLIITSNFYSEYVCG